MTRQYCFSTARCWTIVNGGMLLFGHRITPSMGGFVHIFQRWIEFMHAQHSSCTYDMQCFQYIYIRILRDHLFTLGFLCSRCWTGSSTPEPCNSPDQITCSHDHNAGIEYSWCCNSYVMCAVYDDPPGMYPNKSSNATNEFALDGCNSQFYSPNIDVWPSDAVA